jgi:hypothetical protein
MKKRNLDIHIHLTNRWLYTLIAIGILAIVSIGVYAYGTSNPSTFGHSVGELAPPPGCSAGQFLQYDGSSWVCSFSSSTETDPTVMPWAKTDNGMINAVAISLNGGASWVSDRLKLRVATEYIFGSCNAASNGTIILYDDHIKACLKVSGVWAYRNLD